MHKYLKVKAEIMESISQAKEAIMEDSPSSDEIIICMLADWWLKEHGEDSDHEDSAEVTASPAKRPM